MIKNKRILITGGAGSVGSELVRQLSKHNKILIIDIDETRMFDLVEELKLQGNNIDGYVCDIRDFDELRVLTDFFGPNLIFNAAARKHVTPMERTPMEAVTTNITGTYNLIRLAKTLRAKLVSISTDKVVNSNCVMGATKKVAEIMVKNAGYVSVRFGNVLGSRGSVIPIWQKQIEKGWPLTVTDERMTRYFMTIEDACDLVITAAEEGKAGEIYVLDMGIAIKLIDLAKKIIAESKKQVGIKMIGMRPGEQLTESLMTEAEQAVAIKRGCFWIIK